MKNTAKMMGLVLCAALLFCLPGCGQKPQEPVNLTLWHVYGGQTDSPLHPLINRFNQTVGQEKGIYVQVTSVSNTNTIHEAVLAAANGDPGAAPLPDLFISYPKTVLALPDDSILVDYNDYFTQEELAAYLPPFLEEGTVNDRLVVFPVAKSTEIMFINKTAFDRYAAETGARLEDLSTWEGLFRMAEDYTKWSDAKTPDIPGDGKALFVHDYHFNYFQVGTESLGEDFFRGDTLALGPAFDTAWQPYARAAISGGVWLQGGYATEPLRTADSIVSVASSASVLYYTNTVTYPDNTTEEVELIALPCPVFENGEKLVMQRGAGFCTIKSTPEREEAAVTFLKWLTEPATNVEFVTSLGYMPVTGEAFEQHLPAAIDGLEDAMYRELYRAFLETQKEFELYTPPQMDTYLDLETAFEYNVRLQLTASRKDYLEAMQQPDADPEQLLTELTTRAEESFKQTIPG